MESFFVTKPATSGFAAVVVEELVLGVFAYAGSASVPAVSSATAVDVVAVEVGFAILDLSLAFSTLSFGQNCRKSRISSATKI